MARVPLADNINIALSSDYLALTAHFLYRRLNFHRKSYSNLREFFCLELISCLGERALQPLDYAGLAAIRIHLHFDLVPHQHPDPM